LDTYELLYINEIGKKAMGLNDISHVKCYKALQGKDSPCEFCTIVSNSTTPESIDLQYHFNNMLDNGCDYCAMEVSSHSLALNRV
ncbi:Mur ligase family protein, partial [Clostridioides difficile]